MQYLCRPRPDDRSPRVSRTVHRSCLSCHGNMAWTSISEDEEDLPRRRGCWCRASYAAQATHSRTQVGMHASAAGFWIDKVWCAELNALA